jgi:hypothetical protein
MSIFEKTYQFHSQGDSNIAYVDIAVEYMSFFDQSNRLCIEIIRLVDKPFAFDKYKDLIPFLTLTWEDIECLVDFTNRLRDQLIFDIIEFDQIKQKLGQLC